MVFPAAAWVVGFVVVSARGAPQKVSMLFIRKEKEQDG
jgi:hypothetical protein